MKRIVVTLKHAYKFDEYKYSRCARVGFFHTRRPRLVLRAKRATVHDGLDAKKHSWIYCFRLLRRAAGLLKAWPPLIWPRVGLDGENGSFE